MVSEFGRAEVRLRLRKDSMSEVIKHVINGTGSTTKFWCPGCDDVHIIYNGLWQISELDGELTVHPSVLFYPHSHFINDNLEAPELFHPSNITESPRCHSFVRDGKIQFLSDSTHHLAGQIVDLPPLPTYLID